MKSTTIDKSAWPRGPWDDECDRDSWTDEATGLPCIIKRHPRSGHWCGYVGLPAGHPWRDLPLATDGGGPEVHWGVTYQGDCDGDPINGVCHVAEPGHPDDVQWIGFDCAHSGDLSPGYAKQFQDWDDEYRREGYVRAECASMARQAAAAMERR